MTFRIAELADPVPEAAVYPIPIPALFHEPIAVMFPFIIVTFAIAEPNEILSSTEVTAVPIPAPPPPDEGPAAETVPFRIVIAPQLPPEAGPSPTKPSAPIVST
jgi:hypothetical protein